MKKEHNKIYVLYKEQVTIELGKLISDDGRRDESEFNTTMSLSSVQLLSISIGVCKRLKNINVIAHMSVLFIQNIYFIMFLFH
jgi:hypothetical protein